MVLNMYSLNPIRALRQYIKAEKDNTVKQGPLFNYRVVKGVKVNLI